MYPWLVDCTPVLSWYVFSCVNSVCEVIFILLSRIINMFNFIITRQLRYVLFHDAGGSWTEGSNPTWRYNEACKHFYKTSIYIRVKLLHLSLESGLPTSTLYICLLVLHSWTLICCQWITRRLAILQNLIDRANEKGRRREYPLVPSYNSYYTFCCSYIIWIWSSTQNSTLTLLLSLVNI